MQYIFNTVWFYIVNYLRIGLLDGFRGLLYI